MPVIKCNFSQLLFAHTHTIPSRLILVLVLFSTYSTHFCSPPILLSAFMLMSLAMFLGHHYFQHQSMYSIGFTTETHNVFITYYEAVVK